MFQKPIDSFRGSLDTYFKALIWRLIALDIWPEGTWNLLEEMGMEKKVVVQVCMKFCSSLEKKVNNLHLKIKLNLV